MLNFDFLDKGLVIAAPAHFVYDFSTKKVPHVIFYSLTKFHCLLASLLEMLGNMCIAIVC